MHSPYTYMDPPYVEEVAFYQKAVFQPLDRATSLSVDRSGDRVWSSDWQERISEYYQSHSRSSKGTILGLDATRKKCKRNVQRSKSNPENLEFSELFLAYPLETYALWYLVDMFVQLDAIILNPSAEIPRRRQQPLDQPDQPLRYLQQNTYEAIEVDPSFVSHAHKICNQYERLLKAYDLWTWIVHQRPKSTPTEDDITWLFQEVEKAYKVRDKALEDLVYRNLTASALSTTSQKKSKQLPVL